MKKKYALTLGKLLFDLEKPDWVPAGVDPRELEVEFSTADYDHLTLLSIYYAPVDGKIVIDIG